MAYWAAAQLQPQRDRLALHCLKLFGFETYAPRLLDRCIVHGRKATKTPLMFPGYIFILIEMQWARAQHAPGVSRWVMGGSVPAVVPNAVIDELRAREVGGLIELPAPPKFQRGDRIRVLRGPFGHHVGLYAGMRPRDRVAVLLQMLGGSRRAELASEDVERRL